MAQIDFRPIRAGLRCCARAMSTGDDHSSTLRGPPQARPYQPPPPTPLLLHSAAYRAYLNIGKVELRLLWLWLNASLASLLA